MINRTGEDLIIQEKGNTENTLTLPAVPTDIIPSKDFVFNSKDTIKPILFSYMHPESRSRALIFKTQHSAWCSDAVTIDAMGHNVRFCNPDKKDKEADQQKRIFGVNVNGAPSLFAYSHIVTFTPGYFITNLCDYDITLRLGKIEEAITDIKAGETIAYHCPTVTDKVELAVKIPDLHTVWTELYDTSKEE